MLKGKQKLFFFFVFFFCELCTRIHSDPAFITRWCLFSFKKHFRFLRQYFLLLLINQMASALFRFIAATGRNMIVANTFGSFALLTLFALGGVILSRGMMIVLFYLKIIFCNSNWRNYLSSFFGLTPQSK